MRDYLFFCFIAAVLVSSCDANGSDEHLGDNVSQVVSVFAQDLLFEQKSNALAIDLDTIVKKSDLDRFQLMMDSTEALIILKVSDKNCGLCVDTEIEDIRKLYAKLDKKNIIVLASFDNKRALKLLMKGLDDLQIPAFSIDHNALGLPVDEANMPYYFALNKQRIVSNVFIPKKSFPQVSEAYFTGLAGRVNGSN